VELLVGVEQVDPVQRDDPLARHDAHAEEGGHESRVGRRVEERPEAAGVVAIRMRDPDPADVGRVDHPGQLGHEVLVRRAQAGVDHDGLLCVQDEGVHREEPDARDLDVVAQDGDVRADPVCVHGCASRRVRTEPR